MQADKPDFILVHGDTTTSFCGALVGFFHKIPVGHVEAGLRSFQKYSPWPEEVNRRLVDVVADVYFAPTALSCENLLKEGYKREQIYITGQTAIDAALTTYKENYVFHEQELNKINFQNSRVIAMTAHRRENYGEPMRQMFTAIRRIADDNPDVLIVYPVHLSPTVREIAYSILSAHERILLLEPIDFDDMLNLQARSHFIMSDSGGLQEECVVFHKPLILMRDTTERPEAIETGAVYLAGTNESSIYDISMKLLTDSNFYSQMSGARNPFGDGKTSERIAHILSQYFGFVTDLSEEFL
jgi:UDP-N-acetylglucosamine 2-epimerase (non-hydrolysing)